MKRKVKVDGISYYASVQKPNKMSEKYEISLVVDDNVAQDLINAGLQPAKNQDGTLKSMLEHPGKKVFKFKSKMKVKVVDSVGTPVDCLVGNGSKVRVYGTISEWTFNSKKGISGYLNTVQVIELVEFSEDGIDKVDGGFVSTKPHTSSIEVNDDIEGFFND